MELFEDTIGLLREEFEDLREKTEEKLGADVPAQPQMVLERISNCQEILGELTNLRRRLRPLLTEAQLECEAAEIMATRRLRRYGVTSHLIGRYARFFLLGYGPMENEWGVAPVVTAKKFYHLDDDDLITQGLFEGNPPQGLASISYAERLQIAETLQEDLKGVTTLLSRAQKDIPALLAVLKLEASVGTEGI